MKRLLSFLLIVILLFTGTITVTADTFGNNSKIDLKKAIEIAKASFDLNTEGYDFNQNYHETPEGIKQWSLSWSSPENDENVNITVDADTGDIITMYLWKPSYNNPPKIAKYKREDAIKAADEIIKRLQPDKSKEVKLLEPTLLNENLEYDSYNIQYVRQVNGVPFQGNGMYVLIDKNTLELKNYSLTWYKGEIPHPSKALGIEEGKKDFNEKNELELTYIVRYDNKIKSNKAILVYNLKNGNRPIDAFTGEPIKNVYYSYDMAAGSADGGNMKEESLTPEELKATEAVSDYITKEDALKIGEKYALINKNQNLTYSSLYSYNDRRNAQWSFSWDYSNPKTNEYAYSSISIDAITGEVLNFYKGDSSLDKQYQGEPKYTIKQSEEFAEKFLKEINPSKFAQTEYKDNETDYEDIAKPRDYQFEYVRIVNGIPCPGNSLRVNVNSYTGDIINYYNNWADIDFPKPLNILSLENAYNELYKNVDFKLQYITHYDYEFKTAITSVKLVYVFEGFSGMIDSKTGSVLDYNGEIVKEKKKDFDDIKGHWAENDINLLIDAGILKVDTNNFFPDDKIKQKDFIKFLINSMQPAYSVIPLSMKSEESDKEYDKYYKQAIPMNIITESEKDLDAEVSRIRAAKMMVNAMDLGYLAEKYEIFNVRFTDSSEIPDELTGYAAIISGLEIMKGSNGNFYPASTVTKAETATMIVKFLLR